MKIETTVRIDWSECGNSPDLVPHYQVKADPFPWGTLFRLEPLVDGGPVIEFVVPAGQIAKLACRQAV